MTMKQSATHLLKNLSRRDLFRGASLFTLATLLKRPSFGFVSSQPKFASDPFTLGVASGDPLPDGFVIWTRLALDPKLPDGGLGADSILIRYEIAEDDAFLRIVKMGEVVAGGELAHSVHVETAGLKPNRPYWYRFHAGDATSPIGRAATSPAIDSKVDRLRFAFASCQHYEQGYYHAYRDMLDQQLDLIVHLGDYIYEGAGTQGGLRSVPGKQTRTLDDYRVRYGIYKSDPDLRAAHAECPWLVTWDDHEFDNNYANQHSANPNDDPIAFLQRRAAAYQAYYEHMPLRAAQIPKGPHLKLYRNVSYGKLAQFNVLDTRQYRTPQPCGDGNKAPCNGVFDPNATLLGKQQEDWLGKQMTQTTATWNVLAQQVMMARVDRDKSPDGVTWSMDQWSGYDVARTRLLTQLRDQKIANPVVLTGDIHANYVNDLKVNFDDSSSPIVATEFVGTSVTTGGDGAKKEDVISAVLRDNEFVKFHNGHRGYVSCELTPTSWTSDYRRVASVVKKDSDITSDAKFIIEAGKPGAEKIS